MAYLWGPLQDSYLYSVIYTNTTGTNSLPINTTAVPYSYYYPSTTGGTSPQTLMEKVVEQSNKKEEAILVIPENKKRKFNL